MAKYIAALTPKSWMCKFSYSIRDNDSMPLWEFLSKIEQEDEDEKSHIRDLTEELYEILSNRAIVNFALRPVHLFFNESIFVKI